MSTNSTTPARRARARIRPARRRGGSYSTASPARQSFRPWAKVPGQWVSLTKFLLSRRQRLLAGATMLRWSDMEPAMTERRKPRPRDPLQLAKLIGDIATGQVDDRVDDGKDAVTSELNLA